MLKVAIVAAAVVACASGALAEDKKVGDWTVRVDKDRFSGDASNSKTMAFRIGRGSGLGVRCFPSSGLSIAIVEMQSGNGRFEEGMMFDVKFRADDGKIVETIGIGLNDKTVEIVSGEDIIPQMKNAKEYAFRLTYKSITIDKIFTAGKGAKQAIEAVLKACEGK